MQMRHAGFTLTELVVTLVIVGILAAVAVPRFVDNSAFQNRAAADQAKAVLRYAQKVAIASHAGVTVNITAGSPADCSPTVVAAVINCTVSNDVVVDGGTATVVFDFMGRPVPNIATPVTVGGIPITIEAQTGYVH